MKEITILLIYSLVFVVLLYIFYYTLVTSVDYKMAFIYAIMIGTLSSVFYLYIL
jgi:hypothetical protein